jgi:hypothetical protein
VNSDVINCLVLWEAMRKKEMLGFTSLFGKSLAVKNINC